MPGNHIFLNLLFIGLGGAIGAMSRYGITLFASSFFLSLSKGTSLVGTFAVNSLGCLLAGILLGLRSKWNLSPYVVTGIGFGFLGALTTFSTFSVDTFLLIQQDDYRSAILNVFISLSLCLFMTFLGLVVTQKIIS